MREAIERVIAELEEAKSKLRPNVSMHARIEGAYHDMGSRNAYGEAISRLKEVLANDVPTSNGQTSPSSTDDTTKQIQE